MSGKIDTRIVVKTTADGRVNAVRGHRQLAGLTQAQLATACEVSRQTVVAIEAGDYAPSVYLALRLATVLGTTVETLFAPSDAGVGP
ncbi:MAG: helix-turn-helix transcriptional regulator [Kineosporiaceae bacterium]|nr:helix-turn-helix transcriptional regulator [Kineosporiaceae bacterium]